MGKENNIYTPLTEKTRKRQEIDLTTSHMINKCQYCEVEFESKRSDAKFCSKRCSKRAERGVAFVADKTIPLPVADNSRDSVAGKRCVSCKRLFREIREQWVDPDNVSEEECNRLTMCVSCVKAKYEK